MRRRKPDPVKSCAYCGTRLIRKQYGGRLEDLGRFLRRKYCNMTCMGHARIKPPHDKGSECRHARREATEAGLVKAACEACGSCVLLGLHHKDGDRTNNSAENLMTLCASCHTRWHWQNEKLKRQKKPCSVCGKPASGLGFCQKHYQRFKKHGDPLAVKIGGGKLQRVSPTFSLRG